MLLFWVASLSLPVFLPLWSHVFLCRLCNLFLNLSVFLSFDLHIVHWYTQPIFKAHGFSQWALLLVCLFLLLIVTCWCFFVRKGSYDVHPVLPVLYTIFKKDFCTFFVSASLGFGTLFVYLDFFIPDFLQFYSRYYPYPYYPLFSSILFAFCLFITTYLICCFLCAFDYIFPFRLVYQL